MVSAVKVEEAEGHVVTAVILRGPVVLNGRLEGTVVLRLSWCMNVAILSSVR